MKKYNKCKQCGQYFNTKHDICDMCGRNINSTKPLEKLYHGKSKDGGYDCQKGKKIIITDDNLYDEYGNRASQITYFD